MITVMWPPGTHSLTHRTHLSDTLSCPFLSFRFFFKGTMGPLKIPDVPTSIHQISLSIHSSLSLSDLLIQSLFRSFIPSHLFTLLSFSTFLQVRHQSSRQIHSSLPLFFLDLPLLSPFLFPSLIFFLALSFPPSSSFVPMMMIVTLR